MSRSGWNSHFPGTAGLEYIGVGSRGYPITQSIDQKVVRFHAQRTGTVDSIAIYLGRNTNIPDLVTPNYTGRRVPYIVELMTLANFAVTGIPQVTRYISSAFTNDGTLDEVGTSAEGNELAAANDGLFLIPPFIDSVVDVAFDTASGFVDGRHVLSIGYEHSMDRQVRIRRLGDLNTSIPATPAVPANKWARTPAAGASTWQMGEAWLEAGALTAYREVTPLTVRQFATGSGNRRLRVEPIDTHFQKWDLLNLLITWQAERRLGVGIFDATSGLANQRDVWVNVPIHTPAATGAPSVTSGTEYVIVIRPAYGSADYGLTGLLDLRTIADRILNVSPGYEHFTALDWDLHVPTLYDVGSPASLSVTPSNGVAAVRTISSGAQTDDSQPYNTTLGAHVASGQDARQLAMPVSTLVGYGLIGFTASKSRGPTANLTVTVKRSDNQTPLGSATLVNADFESFPIVGVDDLGDEYRRILLDIGGTLTPVVSTVDLQFASSAASGTPWLVAATGARTTSPGGTGNVTFGGSSSAATGWAVDPTTGVFGSLAGYGSSDLEAALYVQPSSLTASIFVTAQSLEGGTCALCANSPTTCTVTDLPFAIVSWTSTAATGFAYYEVQRQVAGGDWETRIHITTVSNLSFFDFEAPFGRTSCYRIRVVKTDGTFSDWSNIVCATVAAPHGASLIITAPDDPLLNVAYPTHHGSSLPVSKQWTYLDAGETTYVPVYGADGQLAFRPTERTGVQFSRQVIVSALCTAATGTACLEVEGGPLRELMDADVSYLVVRDDCGNMWYASIVVPTITCLSDPGIRGDIWLADVQITELVNPGPRTTP